MCRVQVRYIRAQICAGTRPSRPHAWSASPELPFSKTVSRIWQPVTLQTEQLSASAASEGGRAAQSMESGKHLEGRDVCKSRRFALITAPFRLCGYGVSRTAHALSSVRPHRSRRRRQPASELAVQPVIQQQPLQQSPWQRCRLLHACIAGALLNELAAHRCRSRRAPAPDSAHATQMCGAGLRPPCG